MAGIYENLIKKKALEIKIMNESLVKKEGLYGLVKIQTMAVIFPRAVANSCDWTCQGPVAILRLHVILQKGHMVVLQKSWTSFFNLSLHVSGPKKRAKEKKKFRLVFYFCSFSI